MLGFGASAAATSVEDGALQAALLQSDGEVDAQQDARAQWRNRAGASLMIAFMSTFGLVLGIVYFATSAQRVDPATRAAAPQAVSLAFLPNAPAHPPPLFRIVAKSPYDAGFQHGQLARERIHDWFESREMQSVFHWASNKGAATFAQLKHDNEAEFPLYVEEMRGISEGAGVTMDQVWVANLINDIENLMSNTGNPPDHCSDEYVVSTKGYEYGFAHGHNDDWSRVARDFWYFLSVSAAPGASDIDSCAGVVYPATLVGWAPTWNSRGMYTTQNTLTPSKSRAGGLGCVFVQKRAICPSRSMEETAAALTVPGWSDGASMNVVDLKGQKMANIEIWQDRHSVLPITPAMGNYSHFNQYKHLSTARGGPIDDPRRFVHDLRQGRVDSLPAPRSALDIMARLGDPFVYSKAGTLVTLVLNGTTGRMNVWCCGVSAASGREPVYSWDLFSFFD